MLVNNIRIIMGKKRIDNIVDLMKITGLSRNALNKLWHDSEMDTIKLGTLMQICDTLDIKLSDLVEYEPEERDEIKRQPVLDNIPTEQWKTGEVKPVLKSENKKPGKKEIIRTPVQ